MTSYRSPGTTILILALLSVALLSLVTSCLSFEYLLQQANLFAADGHAEFVTPELHQSLRVKLRVLALVCLLLSFLAWSLRPQLAALQDAFVADSRRILSSYQTAYTNALRSDERIHSIALGLLLILAAALRFPYLSRPIFYDEAFTYLSYASKPLFIGLSNYSEPNNHLLHTLFVHIATRLFGDAEWVLRLPAFTAGMLLIILSYGYTRTTYNKHAALLCAAFLSAASALIEYSTLARGYTILICCAVALAWLAAGLAKRANLLLWACFVSTTALGFYTVPVFLYAFIPITLWLFLEMGSSRETLSRRITEIALGTFASFLLTLLLYLPPLMVSGFKALLGNVHVTPLSFGDFQAKIGSVLLWSWQLWNRDLPLVVQFAILLFFVVGLIVHRRSTGQVLPVAVIALATSAVLLLLQRVLPYRRIWLLFVPFYISVSALGCSATLHLVVPERMRSATTSLLSCAMTILIGYWVISERVATFHGEQTTLHEAEAIVRELQPQLRANDAVLTVAPADYPLMYYASRLGVPLQHFDAEIGNPTRLFLVLNLEHSFSKSGQLLHTSLRSILEQSNYSADLTLTAKKLNQYESASVYIVTPN